MTKRGDILTLGRHRVMCGDSTDPDDVAALLEGVETHAIITDPPYCSGGFQEAGRSRGSIGTSAFTPGIINDTLSTRGYCSLIKSVLRQWRPHFAYTFTDWRMWVNLFDVMEASGYGVRSMIVWDKMSIGMGIGWRAQHELIMFSCRSAPNFDNTRASANVIQCKRTGNPDHPTQKPVDLITKIIHTTSFCGIVGDPFLGSGTTLVACEMQDKTCYGMEMDPSFVDTAVRRWEY